MGSIGHAPLEVAIVGGGITGVALAIGLHARGIPFTLYERTASFREIGAGIGFSPNAERAMAALDPRCHASYNGVAMDNGEDEFQWVDGRDTDEVMFRLHMGKNGFRGCRRSEVLEEWVKLVPAERVRFNKQIKEAAETADGRVGLSFADGTTAEADTGKEETPFFMNPVAQIADGNRDS
jgi:salicylate hydroxylase